MEFKDFKIQLQENFKKVLADADALFVTNLDRDVIWETYLNSFPEDVRQGFNCSSCRHFLKPFANIVAIKDNKIVTLWDFKTEGIYQTVAKNMHNLVISAPIANILAVKDSRLGIDSNRATLPDGSITRWDHFYLVLPAKFVTRSSDSEEAIMAGYRDSKNVFKRSLDEITTESIETVLELIQQNSLYRGEESKGMLTAFLKYKKEYAKLSDNDKDNYCWINSIKAGAALSRMRNNSMGTLLVDISNDRDLDEAVSAFERMMAPQNYKRPNAIITKRMIDDAQKKIEELGLTDSLGRRFAVVDDITINNVLFANKGVKKAMNVFDELKGDTTVNPKKYSKVEEVTIEQFIKDIMPKATNIEVLVENKHKNNLMSLVAPKNPTAPTMFKWDNNFSWSYNNDVTDSIKEQVKAAGGRVDGELRVSLSWFNYDDLDLHVIEPNRHEIYFRDKKSGTSGELDIDMNAGSGTTRQAVENIIWTNRRLMLEGLYKVVVNNYSKRESIDGGFEVEIECNGEVFNFPYDKFVRDSENVLVAEFTYSKTDGIKFQTSVEGKTQSKEIWGLNTNQFQKVSMVMYSPNHWDGNDIGNKHYFFVVEDCKNPTKPRGFYNEFLKEDLMQQKRVFEALGSKMKVEDSDQQISGLGFSSTNKNSVVCKVDGAFSRIVKINF